MMDIEYLDKSTGETWTSFIGQFVHPVEGDWGWMGRIVISGITCIIS